MTTRRKGRGPVRAGLSCIGIALAAMLPATPCGAAGNDMTSPAMVDLVAKVIPTVVSISAHRIAPTPATGGPDAAAFPRIKEAVGSGFVVDPSGYIATNRHVVDGAYEIVVTFSDGRTRAARLVFKSPAVDVAFLKVDGEKPLAAATLASDPQIRIGERVIAVGNPLGLGISVSAGIVSALDRNIKESPYDDFIQTDAAINHGSSGGPLFDEAGEVLGVNTALFTSVDNGGSEGLGFAIPGRDIVFLIDQLKRNRRIRVGWLGAKTQKLTADMAEALSFPGYTGAIVATVTPGSPAAGVGLRLGDIIETIDGKPILDTTTVERAAALSLDKTITLGVWRDGAATSLPVKIVESPAGPHGAAMTDSGIKGPRFASVSDLGLTLAAIDEPMRRRFEMAPGTNGLMVTGVLGGSAGQEAGIRPGDILVSVQKVRVSTLDALDALIADQARQGHHRIILLMQAPGGPRWVALPLRL